MNSAHDFDNKNHINLICHRLWEGREYGKAALLVGSGLSRNALPIKENAKPFPLWKDIAERMFNGLYHDLQSEEHRPHLKMQMTTGLGVLKLAQAYESCFGRHSLNDLIEKAIPHSSFRPGPLHKRLLQLPWTDVFTTNYDTLLENTLPEIINRKYDVCSTSNHLASRQQPRIIKLHGTLPSNSLIITEEDYRRYPRDFAPMVNTVQQSIMENTFLLIGFSADDPNFLSWTGWVRDNLGQSAPQIYLCGLLNLPQPERELLRSRRIVPVDLSHLVTNIDELDSSTRHSAALDKFLEMLETAKPTDPRTWALSFQMPSRQSHSNANASQQDVISLNRNPYLSQEYCLNLIDSLKRLRESYPGWIVCPMDNQIRLIALIRNCLRDLQMILEKFDKVQSLIFLNEINWLLEKSLLPISMIESEVLKIVETFNPTFKELHYTAEICRTDERYSGLNWAELRECWVNLVFALVRRASERLEQSEYTKWINILMEVVNGRDDWVLRLRGEEYRYDLFRLDVKNLTDYAETAITDMASPRWGLKQAGIFLQFGRLNQARQQIITALKSTRYGISLSEEDYVSLSTEGWLMFFNWLLDRERWLFVDPEEIRKHDRWSDLDYAKCNPYDQIYYLASSLLMKNGFCSSFLFEENSFDPEELREVTLYENPKQFADSFAAFQLLRLLEDGGIPFSMLRNCDKWSFAIATACEEIAPWEPLQAVISLILLGDADYIRKWLDRRRVAIMDFGVIEKLFEILLPSLRQVCKILEIKAPTEKFDDNFLWNLALILPEVLSRISFRLGNEKLQMLYDLALELYCQPLYREHHRLHESVDKMFQRILSSMDTASLAEKIPKLLGLPIPGIEMFNVSIDEKWMDPARHVLVRIGEFKTDRNLVKDCQNKVDNLLNIAGVGNKAARTSAIIRLETINQIGGLNPAQIQRFASSIWSKIDGQSRLPAATYLSKWNFLNLPQPEPDACRQIFRQYILSFNYDKILSSSLNKKLFETDDVEEIKKLVLEDVKQTRPTPIEEIYWGTARSEIHDKKIFDKLVKWERYEVEKILEDIAGWWDKNKTDLDIPETLEHAFALNKLRTILQQIVPILGEVILPYLGETDDSYIETGVRVMEEMAAKGFCVLVSYPALVIARPNYHSKIVNMIKVGIKSDRETIVNDAIQAVGLWFRQCNFWPTPKPPDELLNELINLIAWRRQPGLDMALFTVTRIVEEDPCILNEDMIVSLCIGLDYLFSETDKMMKGPAEVKSKSQKFSNKSSPLGTIRWAGNLAKMVSENLETVPPGCVDVLEKWKKVTRMSPLPEIKRIWGRGLND